MPRPPLALAAVLFALSAGPTLAQQTHDTPHVPVPPVRMAGAAEAVDAFHAALRAGDRDAALAVLAEDALIFEAGGAERSRAEYASHHLEADAAFAAATEATVTRLSCEASGDGALINIECWPSGTLYGRPVELLAV